MGYHGNTYRKFKEHHAFKSLLDRHIEQPARDFIVFQVKKDNTIFYQSVSSTDFYIILKGIVRATLLNQKSEDLVLASITGASREAISKVLKALIFKGILKDDGECF